jgi:hypothetical protein
VKSISRTGWPAASNSRALVYPIVYGIVSQDALSALGGRVLLPCSASVLEECFPLQRPLPPISAYQRSIERTFSSRGQMQDEIRI